MRKRCHTSKRDATSNAVERVARKRGQFPGLSVLSNVQKVSSILFCFRESDDWLSRTSAYLEIISRSGPISKNCLGNFREDGATQVAVISHISEERD